MQWLPLRGQGRLRDRCGRLFRQLFQFDDLLFTGRHFANCAPDVPRVNPHTVDEAPRSSFWAFSRFWW